MVAVPPIDVQMPRFFSVAPHFGLNTPRARGVTRHIRLADRHFALGDKTPHMFRPYALGGYFQRSQPGDVMGAQMASKSLRIDSPRAVAGSLQLFHGHHHRMLKTACDHKRRSPHNHFPHLAGSSRRRFAGLVSQTRRLTIAALPCDS